MTLLVDVDHPGSQEDMVSNWEPAHSLLGEAVSGAEIAPCLLALAVTPTSLSLVGWQGLYTPGQLSFGIHSFLCSVSEPGCALG